MHKLLFQSNVVHKSWLMYCRNQVFIHISHYTWYTGRVKHIELHLIALQDVVNRQSIFSWRFCTSQNNATDIMSNALLPHAHELSTGRLHMAVLQRAGELKTIVFCHYSFRHWILLTYIRLTPTTFWHCKLCVYAFCKMYMYYVNQHDGHLELLVGSEDGLLRA